MVVQDLKQKVYTLQLVLSNKAKLMWSWIKSWFIGSTYTITFSYDTKFGNSDDKTFHGVRKIKKNTWKELIFLTSDKRLITVRSAAGLHYRIEEE